MTIDLYIIKEIIKKEIANYVHSRKYVFSIILVSLLLVIVNTVSVYEYHSANKLYLLSKKNIGYQIGDKWRIAVKPNVLSILCNGCEGIIRQPIVIHTIRYKIMQYANKYMGLEEIYPPLDVVSIVIIVLSVFCIIFGFDILNEEKKGGVNRLVYSNSVSRMNVILSKLVAANIVGLIILVPSFVVLILNLISFLINEICISLILKITIIYILSLLYFNVCLCIGVAVSVLFKKQGVIVGVVILWMSHVFLLPKLIDNNYHGGEIYRKVNDAEQCMNMAPVNYAINIENKKGDPKWYTWSKNKYAKKRIWGDINKSINDKRDLIYNSLEDELLLGFISPAISYKKICNEISGTGNRAYKRYVWTVGEYINRVTLSLMKSEHVSSEFRFDTLGFSETLGNCIVSILVYILYCAFIICVAILLYSIFPDY